MRSRRACRVVVLVFGALAGWGIAQSNTPPSPRAQEPPSQPSTQQPASRPSTQQSASQRHGRQSTVAGTPSAQLLASEPAVWMKHDIVVHLQNLPKRYSCDDLWYKFRDVLLELGASPDMQILAYRCESVLGVIARSPSVHLQFEMPEAVQGTEVRWADMQARPQTVRLAPGQPASLDASDCELLRQIKSALLPALSEHVVAYHLTCQADPGAHHGGFSLSVQALIPASGEDARLAARGDSVPKLVESASAPAAGHVH